MTILANWIPALVLVIAGATITGCRTTQVTSGGPPASITPPTPAPETNEVMPAGTTLTVRLNEAVGVDASGVGDGFTATLQEPLVADDGTVVVPEGSIVNGHVSGIKRPDTAGDQAAIALDFDTLETGAESTPIEAEVVETEVRGGVGARDGGVAGGAGRGATAGALLGAIMGGWTGAVVGGIVGGGTGTLIGLGTGDVEPRLPAGTELSLRTTAPIRLAFARSVR